MGSDLESRIRKTGLRLYDLMEEESRSVFRKEYWTGKLFEWCMHNEPFKVQMFRFVDVFGYLKSPESAMRHIREYFSDPSLNFPSALDWGIKFWRAATKDHVRRAAEIMQRVSTGEGRGRQGAHRRATATKPSSAR